jgi:gluconolactonase
VWVITPDGTHLGTIETAAKTANVGWGDDGTVLYITADKTLYRLRTATKGKLP